MNLINCLYYYYYTEIVSCKSKKGCFGKYSVTILLEAEAQLSLTKFQVDMEVGEIQDSAYGGIPFEVQ